jgi:hypothetical protein
MNDKNLKNIFMKIRYKRIELKQILILASSILMVAGVFLKLMQVSVKMSFFGMPINKTIAIDYWQNGQGEGVYILIIALLSLSIIIIKKYKLIWLAIAAYLGVILYSVIDLASNSMKMKNSEMGNMFMDMMGKPEMKMIPREGALFLILGLTALVFAAIVKNQEVFGFKKIEEFDIDKVETENFDEDIDDNNIKES